MEPQRPTASPESASRPHMTGNGHTASGATDEHSPADGFKHATAHFGELKEYATYFISAKLDGVKASVRKLALVAVLGLMGAVVGLGLLITATVLLLMGLAGAIGALFDPDRPWAGALIIGFVVVAAAMGGVVVAMRWFTGSSRKRTIEKYENRKREQYAHFGTSVEQRAREQVAAEQSRA